MLLEIPESLGTPPDKDSTTEIEVACDWLEASVLFSGSRITKPEIADLLKDKSILPDATSATRFVDDVWSQLRSRRLHQGGNGPFDFSYQDMHLCVKNWEDAPVHSFCLLLSHPLEKPQPKKKDKAGKAKGINYTEQGELFERIVEAACSVLWPSWTVHRTGWSKSTPQFLPKVVEGVARILCGKVGNIDRWATPGSKERGLDLVWFRGFGDQRGCFPAFLMQCASGQHYERKLDAPNDGIWQDLLDLVPDSLPRKAFATPIAFGKSEFERNAIQGKCFLLDRMRLLSAASLDPNWIPPKLAADLVKWIRPKAKRLVWRP